MIYNIPNSNVVGTTNKIKRSLIVFSHPRSLVTRCQKLSKIICLLFSAMVISLLFYDWVERKSK